MSKVIVRFEKVQKTYDGKQIIVDNLNLDINEGEFVTMLGPSGSGKTTCLMMLAGFESVTGGNIYINDQKVDNVAPNKRNLGMVFQDYALFPHMTVEENLAFPLEVRKKSKEEIVEMTAQALQKVRLESFGKRRISQLSGGQKQRVAVARSLVFEPQIVLMDEPLGALDKNLREEMQYEIKHLHEALGITFVYVTHDQSEALTMSDKIAVFNEGKVQQYASPVDLYEYPVNSFVANFIGENNILRGHLREMKGDDHCVVELQDGTRLKSLAINVKSIGEKTVLSLRPERVVIEPETSSVDNEIRGKILEMIYLGDHIRMRMKVADNEQFIVKIQNRSEGSKYRVNDNINLGWKLSDSRALDYFEAAVN